MTLRWHDLVTATSRRLSCLLVLSSAPRRRRLASLPCRSPGLGCPVGTSSRARAMADYSRWTKEALVRRVRYLEQALASREEADATSGAVAGAAAEATTRPPKKTMDPHKYATRFIALKLAYLGKQYGGFEYQSSGALPTIEEELWKALVKACLVFPAPGASPDEVDLLPWNYSKCGRTDRGVSAFGQVVALRVRSNRRAGETEETEETEDLPVDAEIPYAKVLNRLLPADIRVLAWCPSPPPGFSARFSCRERQYRYFFTDPVYLSDGAGPGAAGPADGRLDIAAMRDAAARFVGLHDFRNFCKIDPSKQISNFARRIFAAGIAEVPDVHSALGCVPDGGPRVYSFDVRGSAFLWHQIRHMVAVLFLVGQGRESPDVVSRLLDIAAEPGRPVYPMAEETPLVLWDCIFPRLAGAGLDGAVVGDDDGFVDADGPDAGNWSDSLAWHWVGADAPPSRMFVDGLWRGWRAAKMDEILANRLLNAVTAENQAMAATGLARPPGPPGNKSHVFEGGNGPQLAGVYVPLLQRARLASPEEVNDKYARQKGFASAAAMRETGNWRAVIKARKESEA